PLELELELARLEHAHERLARRRQATQAEVNSLQLRAISEGLWLYAVRSAGLRISSGGGRRELALAEALAAHLPPHLQERELLPVRLHAARVFIEEGRFELARETLAPCRALVDESLRDTPEDFELVLVESLLQWRQGVYDAAASSLRARLADVQRALGEDSFLAVNFLVNLTAIEQERGRPDEAIELMQETARRVERVDGPDALRLGPIFNNLGLALMSVGRLEEAERAVRRAGVIWTALHGADHPQLAFVYTNLGDVYAAMGRDEEAAAELARALEIRRAGLGEQHPYTAYTHLSRARLFLKTGDPEAASAEATAALETRAALYDESSWLPAEARVELGRALLARGELDAARAEAALARAAIERSTGAPAELGAALTRLEAALR
ncbi:MAG: tetratricopeptide repeat protein, partial [Myxococcales bacterium]|nr:tetratricopeptide repeat protein [Myxococcales bacterium]